MKYFATFSFGFWEIDYQVGDFELNTQKKYILKVFHDKVVFFLQTLFYFALNNSGKFPSEIIVRYLAFRLYTAYI